jgi:hypothetical protein
MMGIVLFGKLWQRKKKKAKKAISKRFRELDGSL